MITSGLSGCLDESGDGNEDERVPLTLGVTSISSDESAQSFNLEIILYNITNRVMSFDGELRIIIKDPDYMELMNRTYLVKKEDFTSRKNGIILTIFYTLSIPYSDLSFVSEAMKVDPVENLRVYAWFTYKNTTIREYELWKDPTNVCIEDVVVDEENETVDLEMYLYDSSKYNTKGPGTLELTAWDSEDFEMYNGAYQVRNDDYWLRFYDEIFHISYEVSIPFSEFKTSHDRLEDKPGPPGILQIGRRMRFGCEFSFGNTDLVTGPEHLATHVNRVVIPEALLYPNEFPTAVLEGPRYVVLNKHTTFSARKSTDDLYPHNLTFVWFWGDGNFSDESSMNYSFHVYKEPGEFNISVMVIDAEDYASFANLTIQVVPNPYIIVNEAGVVTDGGDHHNKSFVNITIWNVLGGEAVDVPPLDPKLFDDATERAMWNGTDGTPPDYLPFNGRMTLVLYFEYLPSGATEPQPFEAVRLNIWMREFILEG